MSEFSDYVTSTAFSLALSKPQIECLCQIEQTGGSWQSLMTSHALQRKGLVRRHFSDAGWRIELTDAGRAVLPLLKLAGLWIDCTTPAAAYVERVAVRPREAA